MLKITVNNEVSEALLRYSDRVADALIKAGGTSAQIIVGRSVTQYMRDAKGEPKRRRKDDTGPLRIVTGRLVRSLIGARTDTNEPESVYRISLGQGEVVVTFGSKVPYAAIHEFGGFAGRGHTAYIPGRPYLGPAIADTTPQVINAFDIELTELARELGLEA